MKRILFSIFALLSSIGLIRAQVTVNPGGGSYATVSAAFAAINAGTHTGAVTIEISANTTEPAAPTVLVASGVGTANYSSIAIYPTVAGVVVSNTSSASRGVLEFNGADNITINGNLNNGTGTSRDLTIRNNTATTNSHTVLWFQSSTTTPQLGCQNISIRNVILYGNADVSPTRTTTTAVQMLIAFSSTTFPTISAVTAVNNSNITITNNQFLRALTAIHIGQSTTAALTGLNISSNVIGSTNTADYVLWRGIYLGNCSGAIIQDNTIQNLKSIIGSSGSAIEIVGTTSANNTVRRNLINGIWNTSTGGWASHGVNLNGGNNHTVVNNVIYDMLGANYASATTTFNAFGIRLSSGTGHKLYYNSVYLYGTVNSGTAISASAALAVTSTVCTGLDIRNNIFSNAHVSTVTGYQAYATRFASGYPFSSAGNTIDYNYYGVPSSNTATTSYFVGGTFGAGISYANLAALKTAMGQNNNSLPVANDLPPFTSTTDLTIPASTGTLIESGATPISGLGLPNTDYLQINRPAGTGNAPDMGAYEFEGVSPGVYFNLISMSPDATSQCVASARDISIDVTTGFGTISTVDLNYSVNGVPQTPISMLYFGGNNYQAQIPAVSPGNAIVTWSVTATNTYPFSATYTGATYTDEPLTGVTAVATATPSTFCAGSPVSISAAAVKSGQTRIVGAGATTSATYSNPFYSAWSNNHTQHIVLASELTAAGLHAGNITKLGLDITVPGTLPMIDLSVKIGHTTSINANAFMSPVFTTVFTSASYLPTAGVNMLTFSTPFNWDGISNIVIEFCHGNAASTATMSRTCKTDNTPFASTIKTNVNAATSAATICSDVTTNLLTYTVRPQFHFEGNGGLIVTSISWSDGATTIGNANPLTVYPTVNTTYTATFDAVGCNVPTSPSVSVTPIPVISAPSATNSTQCGIAIPTASVSSTAGGSGTGMYTWYDANVGGNVLQNPPLGTTLNTYYTNDFSSPTLSNASLAGVAAISGGVLNMTPTPALTSQQGGILVNATGYPTSIYQVDFNANVTGTGVDIADGFSYSFGDDVSAGGETLTSEWGSGSKLRFAFDSYGASTGAQGIYITYGTTINNPGQTIGTNGVLAYSTDVSWRNNPNVPIQITINAAGQASVSVNGTPILSNVQLPTAFINANRSNWAHVVKARSGGISGAFGIDDLVIQTNQPTAGSTTWLNTISATTTWYVAEMGNNGCESLRTPVTATVTAPPALTTSGTRTICNATVEPISITSVIGDYDTYVWSPITNLYEDAAATIPYTLSSPNTLTTVYYKSSTAGSETITVNAANASGCTNVATAAMQTLPASIAVTSSQPSLCVSGSSLMAFTPTTNLFNASLQWAQSPTGSGYTDISGANGLTYNTGTITSSNYYQMTIKGDGGVTCLVDDFFLSVNNPLVLTTTPASRCGTGTVNLAATVDASSTAVWYGAATGGAPLASGNAYTTPSISATTTYYVAAVSGLTTASGGRLTNPTVGGALSNTPRGVIFTTTKNLVINEVGFLCTGATATVGVSLYDAAGTTQIGTTQTLTVPANAGTSTTPVLVNIPTSISVPSAGTYRIFVTSVAPASNQLYYEFTGVTGYPYAVGSSLSITGSVTSLTGALSSTTYYYFYRLGILEGCESPRTAVTATVSTPPSISATVSNNNICAGETTNLNVTSSNDPDYTYVWTPGNLSGAAQAVSPTSTTIYTVTASDNTVGPNAGCVEVSTVLVTVRPLPVITSATASPTTFPCGGGSTTLNATQEVNFTSGTGTVSQSATGQTPYSHAWEGIRTQYLILASELTAANVSAGNFTSLAFNVLTKGSASAAFNPNGDYKNFTLKMSHTTSSALTGAYAAGTSFTTVYGPTNYTTAVGPNVHTFSTPFAWNGTDNVVVEVCYENDPTALGVAYTNNDAVASTATAFTSVYGKYEDNALSCGSTTGTIVSGSNRPNMVLTGSNASLVWNPGGLIGGSQTVTTTTTTTYTVTATSANGCTATQTATVTVDPCNTTLNITAFVQGYYLGSSSMNSVLFNQDGVSPLTDCDNITVELHSDLDYVPEYTTTAMLSTSGAATATFTSAVSGSYYVVLKHRNSLEVWSATAQSFPTTTSYNFSAAGACYADGFGGTPTVEVETNVWALWSGDIDQDGYIDVLDYNIWDPEYQAGFPHTNLNPDLDGNGYVELDDYNIWDPNYQAGDRYTQRP